MSKLPAGTPEVKSAGQDLFAVVAPMPGDSKTVPGPTTVANNRDVGVKTAKAWDADEEVPVDGATEPLAEQPLVRVKRFRAEA